MDKFKLLFNTVKFLKAVQIYYRLFYFLRRRIRVITGFQYALSKKSDCSTLVLKPSIYNPVSNIEKFRFSFLNLEHDFKEKIDWNFQEYGKLWTYNLTYFDFLNQGTESDYESILQDFIEKQENITVGFEPFPLALRGLNWIKYLTYQQINDNKINDNLYAQYYRLMDNLEYHLLGNHLLENGFSLLFAAYYFRDEIFYAKAKEILKNQLEEQILDDGAHFELTPMYHQIMLFRLLDTINLIQNNDWKNQDFLPFLTNKSKLMLSWLEQITYINGDIPLLNDSANGIAPSSKQLFEYSSVLNINYQNLPLTSSGYRKIVKSKYEALIDIGCIGASYIPGHVHSDMLNFEVYREKKPFIVDTGLSTYEANERRMVERSTSSHNTVEIYGLNQSEVWGGFRVANRANIIFLKEEENHIEAAHDGYRKEGVIHKRIWNFNEESIVVYDELSNSANAVAYIHFHPGINQEEIENKIFVDSKCYELIKYEYSKGFNELVEAWCLKIKFSKTLKIEISLNGY